MGENIGASEAAIPAARASSSIGIVDLKKLVIIGVVIFGILNSHSEDERTLCLRTCVLFMYIGLLVVCRGGNSTKTPVYIKASATYYL